jgi:hypothetical protein
MSRGTNILAELAMIVIGINIALWFEGWFDDLQDAETERQYLEGLRNDLVDDLGQLDGLIRDSRAKTERLRAAIPKLDNLIDAPGEQQASVIFEPTSYLFFRPSDFTYRSMQESGDFRLLSDSRVKEGILRLIREYRHIETLQQNFIQAMDDSYIPLMMNGFDIVTMKVSDPELVENQAFLNFFAFTLQETDGRILAYERARKKATTLLEHIQTHLGE